MTATPYYSDNTVTLYLGDCRDATGWLTADVLVVDPPYGRAWKQGRHWDAGHTDDRHSGIANDSDTSVRDDVLHLWGTERPAIVFGDLMLAPPAGTKQTLIYRKPSNSGTRGATAGFRRDVEAVYLLGAWPSGIGGRTSILATMARSQGNPSSPQGRYGHPHAKPVDVMELLIGVCPPGVIADPCAGSGSTLIAARNLGRHAVGVELDKRYCDQAVPRLRQDVLPLGACR